MGVLYPTTRRRQQARPYLTSTEVLSRGSVQIFGYNLFYETSGQVEIGPTILFLHESGGSSETWHGQMVGLAQQARCIVPDLPGHGRSEGDGCETIAAYRAAVLAFLDALAIRWPVVVVGACLGAAIAVDLALHAPDRVGGLILSGVSAHGRACDEIREATASGQAPQAFVERLFSEEVSIRLLNERMKRWKLTSPLVRHRALTALANYPMVESLTQVVHSTLLVAGEHDPIATYMWACEMAEQMRMGRVEMIPDAGCLSMAERPAPFNQVCQGFLEQGRLASPVDLVEPDLLKGCGYRRGERNLFGRRCL